jgi:hypothetical protein
VIRSRSVYSLAPNSSNEEYLPSQSLYQHAIRLKATNTNTKQNLSLLPRARQPLPRRIGNQPVKPRSDEPLPSLPSRTLQYKPPTSKKRSRSDMDRIILEKTAFKKPRIDSSSDDIAEHLSERLSRINIDDERLAHY